MNQTSNQPDKTQMEMEAIALLQKEDVKNAFMLIDTPTATAAMATATMDLLGGIYGKEKILKAWLLYKQQAQSQILSNSDLRFKGIVEAHTPDQVQYAMDWINRVFASEIVRHTDDPQLPKDHKDYKDWQVGPQPGLEGVFEPDALAIHLVTIAKGKGQGKKGGPTHFERYLRVPWHLALNYIDIIIQEERTDDQKLEAMIFTARKDTTGDRDLFLRVLNAGKHKQ